MPSLLWRLHRWALTPYGMAHNLLCAHSFPYRDTVFAITKGSHKKKDTDLVSFLFGWDGAFDHIYFVRKIDMVRSFAHKRSQLASVCVGQKPRLWREAILIVTFSSLHPR